MTGLRRRMFSLWVTANWFWHWWTRDPASVRILTIILYGQICRVVGISSDSGGTSSPRFLSWSCGFFQTRLLPTSSLYIIGPNFSRMAPVVQSLRVMIISDHNWCAREGKISIICMRLLLCTHKPFVPGLSKSK